MRAKFRIGQTVRCIGESNSLRLDDDLDYGGAGWRKDRIFKIYSINFCPRGHIYWDSKEEQGVHETHLVLEKNIAICQYGIAKFCKENYK